MSSKGMLNKVFAFFVLSLGIGFEGLLILSNNEPSGLVWLVLF